MNRLYISGPISGTTDFEARFGKMEKELRESGYEVVNPAKMNVIMPDSSTHAEYMALSFELINICDTVLMMNGWEESKGANQEYGYARAKGKTIIFDREKLPEKIREYVCDNLCRHAAEDSDYLEQRCEGCKIKELRGEKDEQKSNT